MVVRRVAAAGGYIQNSELGIAASQALSVQRPSAGVTRGVAGNTAIHAQKRANSAGTHSIFQGEVRIADAAVGG